MSPAPIAPLVHVPAAQVEPPAPEVVTEGLSSGATVLAAAGGLAGGVSRMANGIPGGWGTMGDSGSEDPEPGGAGGRGPELAGIRERIAQALLYPAVARRKGWQGCVVVTFTLRPNGGVTDVRVGTSSGFEVLDRGAIAAVLSAAPFPVGGEEVRITTPIAFRLE